MSKLLNSNHKARLKINLNREQLFYVLHNAKIILIKCTINHSQKPL